MSFARRPLALIVLAAVAGLFPRLAPAADREVPADSWPGIRLSLFGDRPVVENADGVIQLDAPERAEDASTVPIRIRARTAQSPASFVKRILLVIDKNPSPVGAIFTFSVDSGRADLETRVRIEDYTHVRAVAEMNDGRLFMAARFVKAAGGCSAPAGRDQAAAMARLGKMRLLMDQGIVMNRPNLAQLMISHPNNSGLAMDQLTRLYVPAHFVRRIDVSYAGRKILTADVDFTISENPNFRFYFVPREEGELRAEIVDSSDLRFETSLKLSPRELAGS